MMGSSTRRAAGVVVLSLMLAANSACRDGGVRGGTVGAPNAVTTLRWAGDRWPGYYPMYMVRDRFADSARVRLSISEPEDTDRMLADFAAGRYDVVAASFADLLALQQLVPDLRVVLCSDESAGADGIAAVPSIRDVSALRGRRIGVNLGGFAEMLVDTMLRRHGLTPADVELVDLDAAQVPAALRDGRIDAGETWNPYLRDMRAEGYRVLFSSADVPGLVQDCMAVRESTTLRAPVAVREFVRAWMEAVTWTAAQPDSARAFVAERLGHDVAPFADSTGVHLLRPAEVYERLRGTGPTSLAAVGRIYADFLGRVGILRTPPRVAALIDPRWLPIDSGRAGNGAP